MPRGGTAALGVACLLPATAHAQAQVSPDNYEILNAGPPKTEPSRIGVENRIITSYLRLRRASLSRTRSAEVGQGFFRSQIIPTQGRDMLRSLSEPAAASQAHRSGVHSFRRNKRNRVFLSSPLREYRNGLPDRGKIRRAKGEQLSARP